jgi:hypothetical protein
VNLVNLLSGGGELSEITAAGDWAILELMGHVRTAGFVTEEEHFGCKLGRIDIPNGDGMATQYFGGSSVYRLTITTEEVARAVAKSNQPEPVHRWELPAPKEEPEQRKPLSTRCCVSCGEYFHPEDGEQTRCEDCESQLEGDDQEHTVDQVQPFDPSVIPFEV